MNGFWKIIKEKLRKLSSLLLFKDSKKIVEEKATNMPPPISKGPIITSRVYSGSLDDMPEDMKEMLNNMFGGPIFQQDPMFVGRPPAPPMRIISPFYEVVGGKVEEVVFVEPEDEEWGPWGFEEDDELPFL